MTIIDISSTSVHPITQKILRVVLWRARYSNTAVNLSIVEVDWNCDVRTAINVQIGLLSSQGTDGSAIVRDDTIDRRCKVGELGGGCLNSTTCSNRGTTVEREDALIGVIGLECHTSIGSRLVIGQSYGNLVGLADLKRSGRDSDCHKRDNSSNVKLHFEMFGGSFAKCNEVLSREDWLEALKVGVGCFSE